MLLELSKEEKYRLQVSIHYMNKRYRVIKSKRPSTKEISFEEAHYLLGREFIVPRRKNNGQSNRPSKTS